MIRRSMSSKYSQGLSPQALQDWISPKKSAVARPPRSLPANNQFFLLCGAPHNRNYADSVIMWS
jgi:hypothetical protein